MRNKNIISGRRAVDSSDEGFIALIAVILLASGTIAFSLTTLSSAVAYADQVSKKEFRIQARFNTKACLDTVRLMSAKDYFLDGALTIPEFGCTATVSNDFSGHVSIKARAEFNGVGWEESGEN